MPRAKSAEEDGGWSSVNEHALGLHPHNLIARMYVC